MKQYDAPLPKDKNCGMIVNKGASSDGFCSFGEPRAVAEIDTAALAENYRTVSARYGKTIAVVKADAYGHGISLTVPALLCAGCTHFAVATLEEALRVRACAPRAKILILGYTPVSAAALLVKERLTQAVFSAEYARALSVAAPSPLSVHVKLDVGMCRLGLDPADSAALQFVLQAENLAVCGIFAHLPSVVSSPDTTREAIALFSRLTAPLPHLLRHLAATAALPLEEARFDAVRAGLALYGYTPHGDPSLRPAMRVLSPIVQLRRVKRGTPVGYDGTFVATRDSRIGVLPIGYADGLPRDARGLLVAKTHEDRRFLAPFAGLVCMDQCMIDLTDVPAKEGDTVCVISDFGAFAARRGGTPYESLTAISSRVARRQKGAPFHGIS